MHIVKNLNHDTCVTIGKKSVVVVVFLNKSNIWVLRELLSLLSHWPERKRLEISSSNDIIKFDIFIENIISKEHMWILKFSKKNLREKRLVRRIQRKKVDN